MAKILLAIVAFITILSVEFIEFWNFQSQDTKAMAEPSSDKFLRKQVGHSLAAVHP